MDRSLRFISALGEATAPGLRFEIEGAVALLGLFIYFGTATVLRKVEAFKLESDIGECLHPGSRSTLND